LPGEQRALPVTPAAALGYQGPCRGVQPGSVCPGLAQQLPPSHPAWTSLLREGEAALPAAAGELWAAGEWFLHVSNFFY